MKAILRSGFIALAIMALAVPANAGPLEDGVAAYERGDYAAALKFLRPLAEQGLRSTGLLPSCPATHSALLLLLFSGL